MRSIDARGYFVMGKHTSVAWYLTRDEAERVATQLNYRGGIWYTVEACE